MFGKFSTLAVIAMLLICSAGLRVLGGASMALAADDQDHIPASMSPLSETESQNLELDALLSSFRSREEALEKEEVRVLERSSQLKELETTIALKLEELDVAEAKLRELLAFANSASEDDVARLTAVYENMKPKNAATVFEEMDPAFAAGFLARMRPDAAATVMASLKPKTAYAVSVVLAGRHSDTSKIGNSE